MKITAIEPQRNHPERVNVHVDGEYRFALALELLARSGLHAGDEVTEELIRQLEAEDLRWKARDAALNLLSYRSRTAAELRRRLLRKEYAEEIADAVVEDLVERGFVDDAAFAESFVRDRVRLRPKGRRRLAQELRAKGVDLETAHEVIDEVMEDEEVSELELAREAAAKWPPRAGEDALRARRRLYGYLSRRGFSGDAVRQVLAEADLGSS